MFGVSYYASVRVPIFEKNIMVKRGFNQADINGHNSGSN